MAQTGCLGTLLLYSHCANVEVEPRAPLSGVQKFWIELDSLVAIQLVSTEPSEAWNTQYVIVEIKTSLKSMPILVSRRVLHGFAAFRNSWVVVWAHIFRPSPSSLC